MNQGNQRTPCPKCQANNFVGQTNCWQCGSSLPPPESVGAPAPAPRSAEVPRRSEYPLAQPVAPPFPQQPQQFHNQPMKSGMGTGVRIAIWAVVLLPLIVAAAYHVHQRRTLGGIDAQAQAAIEANEKLMRQFQDNVRQSGSISDPGALDPESPTAQARRELKRMEEKGIIPPVPPTDSDGRVHLQSGGTISPEEWQRAKDSLGATGSR
jgi:hypothetical protein